MAGRAHDGRARGAPIRDRSSTPDRAVEQHATLRARPAVDRADERRRIVARRGRRRTVEATVHDAAIVAGPLDELRLDQRGRLEAGDRPACDLHPLPLRVVHDDLGRGAGPAADRGEVVSLPAQRTVHALRDDLDLTRSNVSDAQAAEPTLVAVEGDARAVGRPGERALAGAPRRIAVLERLGDDRLGIEVRVERPEVQEAVDIGDEAGRAAHPGRTGPAAPGHRRPRHASRISPLASARRAPRSRSCPTACRAPATAARRSTASRW